jgi:multidrug resistance efflux pump
MFRSGSDQWLSWQNFVNKKHKLMDTLQQHWLGQNKAAAWFSLASLVLILNGILFTPVFSFMDGKLDLLHLMQKTMNVSGSLQSTTYDLDFQPSGLLISEIDVKQGQHVVAGQILARLNATSLQDAVNIAQANVSVARVNLENTLANARATSATASAAIAAADAAISVAQNNQSAISDRGDANVHNAEVTLDSNQNVLSKTKNATNALIAQAQVQLKQNLLNCKNLVDPTTSTSSSSSTFASISASTSNTITTPTATPMPTPTPTSVTISSNLTEAASTSTTSTLTTSPGSSYSTCVALAYATYQQVVNAARIPVANAQATVDQNKAGVDLAEANADADNTNAEGQVTNTKHGADVVRQSAKANVIAARGQVVLMQQQLVVATAQLVQAEHNLALTILIAPHNGVIATINGTVGSFPGNPINGNGPFIRLVDPSSAQQIQVDVSESDIVNVKVGQPVQFTVRAYGSRRFKGTVSAISPENVANSSGVNYPVIITIDPKSVGSAELLPHMSANATITVE